MEQYLPISADRTITISEFFLQNDYSIIRCSILKKLKKLKGILNQVFLDAIGPDK